MFDYFYGAQSDQFSFYRVPKVMFTDPAFQNVSAEAKILYGLFLDRMGLSARNNWMDEQGRVYIIYTIDQIMKAIGCSDKKVNRMLRELEVVAGLIERKRQGLGKPNLIYVKNFLAAGQNGRFLNRKMDDSRVVETQFLESSEVRGSNTEINNTEYSDTDPFLSADRNEGMRERAQYPAFHPPHQPDPRPFGNGGSEADILQPSCGTVLPETRRTGNLYGGHGPGADSSLPLPGAAHEKTESGRRFYSGCRQRDHDRSKKG